ncbi:MAG: hypothetical protein ACE5HI_20385 [bacterium]
MMHKLVATLNEVALLMSNTHAKIPLEVDIPTFYHKVYAPALKKIMAIADILTIMAYERKNVEQVLDSVNPILDYATEMNQPFFIGFNAKDFTKEDDLDELIHKVAIRLQSRDSFKGFAIHAYRRYRELVER